MRRGNVEGRVQAALAKTQIYTPSDEEIAALLAEEASRRKAMAQERGVLAYMDPILPKGSINKAFLQNTIKSVAGHNKREEIEECWRVHKMQRKTEREVTHSRKRARDVHDDHYHTSSSSHRPPSSSAAAAKEAKEEDEKTRQEWGYKKLQAMKARKLDEDVREMIRNGTLDVDSQQSLRNVASQMYNTMQESKEHDDNNDESSDDERGRKHKKSKKKSKKSKKKKKHKKSRHKATSSSNSDTSI